MWWKSWAKPWALYAIRRKGADVEYFSPETGWSCLFFDLCINGYIHKSENGESLKSIAYGTNGNRLEAYPTLRRCVAAMVPR
jgi:hypothetical protein